MTNSMDRPVPRPGVLDIEAYVPGKSAAAPGVLAGTVVPRKLAARVEWRLAFSAMGRRALSLGLMV